MSMTLNDITNIFDADKVLTTKTTNGLSKCESCPEKGKNAIDELEICKSQLHFEEIQALAEIIRKNNTLAI
ncbi:hypothetical protein F8M41_012610 [Gigaspora margarita]|uniref:Uncharacterized protein n=1 Tax=Gigaspora margarita TaxID=4874 RepID=A0A8H3ZZJ4_GIGMA|nr:hypothetical protein F8M41_012610 [Gigaspora margarita]